MKPETLTALLMDRELGELSPESLELLNAFLAISPAAQAEAESMARTVHTAREAVRHFPGLAPAPEHRPAALRRSFHPWLVRAAALIALVGSGALLGYRAGLSAENRPLVANASNRPARTLASAEPQRLEGLWTQYRVAYDGQRKTFAVEKCR